MRSKESTFVLVAALFISIAVAALTLTGGAQNIASSKKQDDATPVQEGLLTEKQKHHSKLFKRYDLATRGRKLRDLVAEKGDVEVVQELGDVLVPDSFNIQAYLNELTCKADAVVLGTVQAKSSQLIEEGTFIFTDYELLVEEVLKSPLFAINPNTNITVTRVGGSVSLNGHIVRAIDHRQEALSIGGHYLLFLRLVPATSSFRAFADSASEDTFQLVGRKVKQTSGKALPLGRRQTADLDSFMIQVKSAAQSPCSN